jgi:iron complex outermembrane receptor protein
MIPSNGILRADGAAFRLQFAALACGVMLGRGAMAQNATESAGPASAEPTSDALEQVVITGTMIHGERPTGSELVTLDRDAIVATGAQSTTNLMTNLPQLASFNNLPIGTVDFANPVPRFNIRNSGATLVLLNGHRMVGSGILQTTPDPSAIPISMIQRVEVLPDGASATYGADAVGGVVNFILRDHFDGAETRANYGTGKAYHEYDLSQLFGKSWSSGNVLASFEYTAHNNFAYGERDFYNNDVSSRGGKNHFVNNCSPPNIVLGATSYAPPDYAAGTKSLCDPTRGADLLPYEHRSTWFLAGRQSLTDKIELTGDAFYSKRNQTNHVATSTSVFTITNANPFFQAPPGTGATTETVDYWFNKEFGPTRASEVDVTSLGVNLALDVEFGKDWHAKLSGNYGKGTLFALTPAVDGVALTAAAAGTTADTAVDPFTGKTSSAVLAAIGGGGVSYTADQDLKEGSLNLDGPLFALPGGDVSLAVGAQIREEGLSGVPYRLVNGAPVNIPNGPQAGSRRDVAEYVELFIPIVGTGNAISGMQKLVLSLAGRRDDYSDFGSTTNPKFSLDYAPIESLTLHATASTSFQAPSLGDMRSVDTRLQTQPNAPFTPSGAQATIPEIYIAGGTPTLQPQTARTYTAGFDLAPPSSALNAGATYWHSRIKKQIGLAFPFQVPLFTNPAFSTFWYGPGGQPLTAAVLDSLLGQFRVDAANAAFTPAYRQALLNGGYIVDLRRKNLGETTIDGIDFHVNYNWRTANWGDLGASIAGTRELHRMNIPGPGAPLANLSGTDPQIQGRTSLDWSKGQWGSGINVNYVGSYIVTGTDVGNYRVSSYTTTDVRLTYHTGDSVGFLLDKMDITLQATNIFDRAPPFLLGTFGYTNGATAHSNPIGRLVSVSLLKRW